MAAPDPGVLYHIYAGLTALAAPALRALVTSRMRGAGVADVRIAERFGMATEARPEGPLIWFHAVSVGEALSILGLVGEIAERRPDAQFLITSVSHTSSKLVAERLPPRTRHQFAPLDTPGAVLAFLGHWRPALACFVESELWPRLIVECEQRGIPLALVNARLSARSQRRWRRFPGTATALISRFSVIAAQTQAGANALEALGADAAHVFVSGDLKAASPRLPINKSTVADFARMVEGRRAWAATSTHPGEEAQVTEAHSPERLLILAPRHPERGDEVAVALRGSGWRVAQRSKGETLEGETEIYLADTLGELGLWYAVCPVVFLGGSLEPIGGHNPFEPAQFGCAVLHGPHVTNFRETYAQMAAAGASREVPDARALRAALEALDAAQPRKEMRAAALRFSEARETIPKAVAHRLLPLLPA
ncbi:MAG: 3-deoxy-D-manno-octulosonic acid transferase [Pseudomonadota bacterium]